MQVVLARVVNMYDDIYDVIVNTTPAQVPRTQGILVVEARVYIQKKGSGWAGCVCGGETNSQDLNVGVYNTQQSTTIMIKLLINYLYMYSVSTTVALYSNTPIIVYE